MDHCNFWHEQENPIDAVYRRGDLFEQLRNLMEAWAAVTDSKPMAMVLPMKR